MVTVIIGTHPDNVKGYIPFPVKCPVWHIRAMSDPEETILQRRVKERLEATGKKPAPLAKSIGVGESFVRDIIRGRAANPAAANLKKLATALNTSVEYLLGETDEATPSGTLGAAFSLPDSGQPTFAGYVAAGVFRPVDEYFQQDGVDLPESVRRVAAYPKARQYAYRVEGKSMDLVGIDDGMWIVAADAGDYVDVYGELQSGDLVVVQRTRFQGAERELTVKELQYYPNRYELLPRSSDARYKPIVVPHDHQANGDEMEVQIVGVVLSAVRSFLRRRT